MATSSRHLLSGDSIQLADAAGNAIATSASSTSDEIETAYAAETRLQVQDKTLAEILTSIDIKLTEILFCIKSAVGG